MNLAQDWINAMKRYAALILGCVFFLIARPATAQPAMEKAEKRLAELLTPGGGAPVMLATKPLKWKASPAMENFAFVGKPTAAVLVRLPLAPIKEVKPRPTPEDTPLASFREQPKGPKEVQLPTKPLIKLPSLDVHTPLPIPILAQPAKDRASLGDPALQASLDATLKQIAPKRERPVPFIPLNLPDPFENVRYGQLRNPPEENPMPPVVPLVKPTAK
jgi:hypothetical protein